MFFEHVVFYLFASTSKHIHILTITIYHVIQLYDSIHYII